MPLVQPKRFVDLARALLQRIANENGLSETAFFVRKGPARAELRWFTPAVEVDLCGHATLATAHVLFTELGQTESPVAFDTKSGPLYVTRKGPLIELDFPSRPAAPAEPPGELLRGLRLKQAEVLRSERMWLCVYPTADDVLALSPDFGALGNVVPGRIIPTAPGKDCDFVSRFFVPRRGRPRGPRDRLSAQHAGDLLGSEARQDVLPRAPGLEARRGTLVRSRRQPGEDGRPGRALPEGPDHGLTRRLGRPHFSFIS